MRGDQLGQLAARRGRRPSGPRSSASLARASSQSLEQPARPAPTRPAGARSPRPGRSARRTGWRTIRRHGRTLPRRVTSLRTGVLEPGQPRAVGCGPGRRRRGPRPRVIAATQVVERNGCSAASSAAGHTHSSRSRICWTAPHVLARAAARGGRRGAAAGPRSHRPVRAGSSAAARSAGRSAPRPCRRSCRWSGPRSCRAHDGQHRLDAHERHAPLGGELTQHPPPVPGRLARHRHPGEARSARPARRPSPTPRPDPTPGTGTSAAPAPSSRGR